MIMMGKKLVLLGAILFSLLLFGCVTSPQGNEDDAGGNTAGGSGGDIVDVGGTTSSGMSNPDKCRGLPPAQMADCLEEVMGN